MAPSYGSLHIDRQHAWLAASTGIASVSYGATVSQAPVYSHVRSGQGGGTYEENGGVCVQSARSLCVPCLKTVVHV